MRESARSSIMIAMQEETQGDGRAVRQTRTQRTLARVEAGDGVGNRSRQKALARSCPTCGAQEHKACVSPKGDLRWSFHKERRPNREQQRQERIQEAARAAGIPTSSERAKELASISRGPDASLDVPTISNRGMER